MSAFTLTLCGFLLFVVIDALLIGAVVYHLMTYTLPEWKVGHVVALAAIGVSLIFLGLAMYSFVQIPFS